MQELYRIGGKRTYRTKKGHFFRFFTCLLLTLLLLFLLFNLALRPHVVALTEAEINHSLSSLCADIIGQGLASCGYRYDDFIHLVQSAEGKVQSLAADMVLLNTLRYRLAGDLLRSLHTTGEARLAVPLFNLSGILLFSGKGPDVSVRVKTAQSLYAGFETAFTSVGFNQTIHTVLFRIRMEVTYLMPGKSGKMTYTDTFAIAQTVIVGEVPSSLTQINRFAQEMEEIEIDDAVDFGNVLS